MSTNQNAIAAVEAFKAEIQKKIQALIAEFADGKLSREQFNVIYERYSSRLEIADQAMFSGNPDAIAIVQGGPATIAVKAAYMGIAIGLAIYHNKSGTMVDTLGEFDVPVSLIAPTLNDFSNLMDSKKYIDRRVEKIGPQQWVLFAAGRYTTIVTLFKNEPSQNQIKELERLHHDFEEANQSHLAKDNVDKNKLAYPFLRFVQRKLKKS
jgi:hypothetical protein